ncbi:CHAT domain-containing protein [Chelatococcus asaccharovorans]|uniref:CHAT domain-containing protein n=1 Tax=Chelatococcus asaccharovorans TaxID=28210 RepID=UPI00224C7420|nr:CHAT domain-containing tetratricopeptide repeat protein [Chelatococcus asaccharovorans]CAH1648936.1 CHAT domain-containing protein [Chelatococcus asaccharovorans]CAH1687282.1 CHAT domain-containing protein [Chelatococcus asaccharovorans]
MQNNLQKDRAAELLRSGRFDEARAAADALLAAGQASPAAARSIVSSRLALAGACLNLARFEDARHYAQGAFVLTDTHFADTDATKFAALEILQDACIAMGRLTEAHDAGERALAIAIAAHGQDSVAAARATQRLGAVLARVGDVSAARVAFIRAKDALMRATTADRADVDDTLATTLANLASTYQRPDEIELAQAIHDQALRLRRRLSGDEHVEIAQLHSNLGLLLSEAGQDDAALRSCERSLALRRRLLPQGHPDVARSLMEVGWMRTRLGNADGATDALLEALLLLSALDMPTVEARAHFLLGSLLAESNAPAAAILFEKLCVNGLQRLRHASASHEHAFLGARQDIYRHLAESLIRSGRLPEALQVISMLKEFELDDVTNGVLRPVTLVRLTPFEQAQADMEAAVRREMRDTLKHTTHLTPADSEGVTAGGAAVLKSWFARLRADFAETDSATAAATAQVTSRRASVPQDDLAAGSIQLQYLLAQDGVEIIVSTAGGQRHYHNAFAPGEVHRLVLALRASIAQRSASWRGHAVALHELLIGPIEAELDDNKTDRLTISLDGVLRYLPLGVLHDGRRHLLERFALTVSAGGHGPGRITEPAPIRRAAGFGVTRALANHRALRGVRDELFAIVGTADNAHGVVDGGIFLDTAFTADALRSALKRRDGIVHIASHFVFRPARENESYLLLGDGTKLTLAQLAELRFDGVDLLTLSACETAVGGGHRQSGSEFEGLGALALNRGAAHVIATLWPIRDFTSAALMREFYRLRFREDFAVADALRQAQLQLLTGRSARGAAGGPRGLLDPDDDDASTDRPAREAHPYYWAPYVLMR